MKKLLLLTTSLLISNFIFSQCNGRYETEIFSSAPDTTVNYSDVYNDNAHKMDIYIPDGDTVTNRPIILYMHGGAFTAGDKSMADCIDFCKSFAKRGYVTASLNYRLSSDPVGFLISNEAQYETVLKAVSDAKAAVRYFRKSFANGNPWGIDPNTIFAGGYSAGAVTAIHQAYIDNITDLPSSATDNDGSSFNVQDIVTNLGGPNGLEGDAGNYGYSSELSGVISFAGGINDVSWIDSNDEPLVSVQGTNDATVSYNCGPGLNNSFVLTLCGAGEMHPQADLVGVINDKLIFSGEGHGWAGSGDGNPKFIQAIGFTSDFLFPLLPCNSTTDITEISQEERKLIKIVDVLGRVSSVTANNPLLYIYSDGSVEHKIIIK
ncbi:MAG: alpha/beta hydrolase [Bacteroidota bacterium]|nr:alpha/beta hydrolase [Bacteroidota bacterium]